ncbi:MAG: plasmid maintenance protein CcdB [Gammaproteobacteria bacterium]|nr:MAG: plasmid maintenance protein CcdB [Gammaproteobacteria bacterium]
MSLARGLVHRLASRSNRDGEDRNLTPLIEFDGEAYVLMTPQLAGVARKDLGVLAGSVAEQRQSIVAPIDFLIAGFYDETT